MDENRENLELWYFGTDAQSHGHYIWTMGEQWMKSSRLCLSDWPFNAESIAKKDPKNPYSSDTGLKKGDARFFQIAGHSIWYIEGSAKDQRGGTKSVWWVKKLITREELKEIILANKPSQVLIKAMKEKMNFEINWGYEPAKH